MMMTLGFFVFGMRTLAYQEMSRDTDWTHAKNDRVGAAPSYQFVGKDEDKITLPCTLMSDVAGSPLSLVLLRKMADSGHAWPLIEGTGRLLGLWVITQISEKRSVFFKDGAARKIEFSLSLSRVADQDLGRLASDFYDFL